MKKVGIVSCYFKHNYGSMLQAYATQKILDDLNIPNETINVDYNQDFKQGKKKYYMSQVFNFDFIKSKLGMVKLKFDKKIIRQLGKNISIRDKKYNEFEKKFHLSRPYITYNELNNIAKEKYTDVLVGSDQLWLPVNVVADYYTLNWVPDEVNKISFATSFGISEIPDKYKAEYDRFLKRIDCLSVREESGCKIIKKLINKDATLVCDPTLLLSKDEWMGIQEEQPIINGKYILCYFLGKNKEHRKFAERLKEKTGCKIVSLNHADEYVKYSDIFADETPYDIGPAEWINLIRNAEYVCTDSFHGTVFSLINNKKFFTFERYSNKNAKVSTNSRIYSLLGIFNLNERILTGKENIEEVLKCGIDFSNINSKLEEFRTSSREFLRKSIKTETKKNENKYIEIQEKTECCGCTACKNICPNGSIEMVEDEEGFLYPVVDKTKCLECGMCKKVCPIINAMKNKKEQKAYIFQNNDEKIRKESTSGGAFSAIAEYVLQKNGIVYGVVFNDEFKVVHKGIEDKDEIWRFRNSKYVQSEICNCYLEVKENLQKDRLVCFSGTSCQVEGLKRFLKSDYDNLIVVDVVCRAVPSPLVWKKYLEMQRKKYTNIDKILFRDKYYGYKYSNLSIYDKDNNKRNEYHKGVESDPYLRAFFSNICDRPSCYNCKFKKQERESDITIWDCFDVEKYNKTFDDDKGTTRILTNSIKGNRIIKQLSSTNRLEEIPVESAVKGFLAMFQPVKYNLNRNKFFEELNKNSSEEVFNKFFKDSIKVKIERTGRNILVRTGIYKNLIKIGKIIRRRD